MTAKRSETYEFFYCSGSDEGNGVTDFSGETSVFDTEKRIEFLRRYADQAKEWFEDPGLCREVAPRAEVLARTADLKPLPVPQVRTRTALTNIRYAEVGGERRGWTLYYKGAAIREGELQLDDRAVPPVPCAKYGFAEPLRDGIMRMEMDVWIDESYTSRSEDIHYVGSIGRTIELRWQTLPAVKVKFYSTGYVKAFGGSGGIWHPQTHAAGTFRPGEWTRLRLTVDLRGEVYGVQVGEQEAVEGIAFPRKFEQLDQLFFDGGMHPGGTWKVRNIRMACETYPCVETSARGETDGRGENDARSGLVACGGGDAHNDSQPVQFFDLLHDADCAPLLRDEAWTSEAYDDSTWKSGKLPLAIGGFDQRDQFLLIRKTFSVESGKQVSLYAESLDPHGEVFVNGRKVLDTDDFMRRRVDLTPYVRAGGDNVLAVRVYPRAPEVYYHWHRNDDSYHGWFAGRLFIEQTGKVVIREPKVKTNRLLPDGRAEVEVEATVVSDDSRDFAGVFTVAARKWFPEEAAGDQRLREATVRIAAGASAVVRCRFVMAADCWEPDHPALYRFTLELIDEGGAVADDETVVTGIRTIDQEGGTVHLNGKPVMLNGALLMQFLPPAEHIPINHVCPSDEQLVWQMMLIRRMGGNTARLHMLGYGSNDPRYAEIADQLGVMLIWTTRLIDSLESVVLPGAWKAAEAYRDQALQVINHPSIVMWEGSNEFHGRLEEIDKMYDAYVDVFAGLDETRLLSPCSHLYYGGGLYGNRHQYYNDDGTKDQNGEPAEASYGWTASNVVRSCHPYIMLNGYGQTWDTLRKQRWKWQDELLNSRRHAYLVTEFAITGDPNWEYQRGEPWHHVESYEKVYEDGSIGRRFTPDEWQESQAFQGFAAFHAVKRMRLAGADGLVWCCLTEGANNVTYRKPPIDFYGRAKLGFYGLRMGYEPVMACHGDTDVVFGDQDVIRPTVLNIADEGLVDVIVTVLDEDRQVRKQHTYHDVQLSGKPEAIPLEPLAHEVVESGYYTVKFEVVFSQNNH